MNFRIVPHLFRTDWQRLRWLIAACWVLLLATAWPSLTFSPGSFSLTRPLFPDPDSLGTIWWSFRSLGWLSTLCNFCLAGALGYHARGWAAGRPVRRMEVILAKVLGLAIFLILPISLIAAATSLNQSLGIPRSLESGLWQAALHAPLFTGVLLFGALCGGLWSLAAGLSAAMAASMIATIVFPGANSPWFRNPNDPDVRLIWALNPWLPVAGLALLLMVIPRDLATAKRIGLAIMTIILATRLSWILPPAPGATVGHLPDWSQRVRPVLMNPELNGALTTAEPRWPGPPGRTPSGLSSTVLSIPLMWDAQGLPEGIHAFWTPSRPGKLESGGHTISAGLDDHPSFYSYRSGISNPFHRAIASALSPGKPLDLKPEWIWMLDGDGSIEDLAACFEPVPPGRYSRAALEIDLTGTAYRMDKILDVPLGTSGARKADGLTLHIRQLPPEQSCPVVEVCFIFPFHPSESLARSAFGPAWTAFLYLPKSGDFPNLPGSGSQIEELSPGCRAIRRVYRTSSPYSPEALKDARFIIVRQLSVARMSGTYRGDPLPFTIMDRSPGSIAERRSFRAPAPVNLRPDPSTATGEEFAKWMDRSFYPMTWSEWETRDLAGFVPRHLDQILSRRGGTSPPSVPEGRAIALACPETRRDEVIAALVRQNQSPGYNWLPDVILRRDWTRAAIPQIRQLARDGVDNNPYSMVMLATLEDPEFYPAILVKVETGIWMETYLQIRRLPGIEPGLGEAISKYYHHGRKTRQPGNPRETFATCLVPAAHGLPEALAELLDLWKHGDRRDLRIFEDELREVFALPENETESAAAITNLARMTPADFRYDSLARLWVPQSEPLR